MKLSLLRNEMSNRYSETLKNTSQGSWKVKGYPLIVKLAYSCNYWCVDYWPDNNVGLSHMSKNVSDWFMISGLHYVEAPSRAQALDALEQALLLYPFDFEKDAS